MTLSASTQFATTLVSALLFMCSISQAHSDLDAVIDERACHLILDQLKVPPDEINGYRAAYDEYIARIHKLEQELEERLVRLGRDEAMALKAKLAPVQDPANHTATLTAEQRRELFIQTMEMRHDPRWQEYYERVEPLYRVIHQARLDGDRLRNNLALRFSELHCPDSNDCYVNILRTVQRTVLDVSPRGNHPLGDFSYPPDLFAILYEALQPGAELELMFRQSQYSESVELIGQLIESYDAQLDQYLERRLKHTRRGGKPPAKPEIVVEGDREFDRDLRVAGKWWFERFKIALDAVQQIQLVLWDADLNEAADRLMLRFWSHVCPEIMQDRWPHAMTTWLEKCDNVTDDQRKMVLELQYNFKAQWTDLQRLAIESGITLMRAEGRNYLIRLDSRHGIHYVNSLLDMHQLSRETIRELVNRLDEAQLNTLRIELKRQPGGNSSAELIGPRIDLSTLRSLGRLGEYRQPVLAQDEDIQTAGRSS